MFARVTAFEIDTVRMDVDSAVQRFKELILPDLRQQAGYQGVLVLRTPLGKGLLVSLWQTEAAAEASLTSGFYEEQVAKFVTLLKQPPGRDHYEVAFAEGPAIGEG